MATSSSRNFNNTCDEICEAALDLVGALNQGSATLAAEKAKARDWLNRLAQSLSSRGIIQLWTVARRTDLYVSNVLQNVVTSGLETYDLGQDVHDVVTGTVFIRTSSIDSQLLPMSYEEYALEGSKSLSGKPTRYLLEKNQSYTDSGNSRVMQGRLRLVLHPTPNNSTDVIGYTAVKKLQDFDAATNDPDMPPVWMRAMVYGLAADLAFKYGLDIQERRDIRAEFDRELDRLRSHDTQRGSMTFTPRIG
jgi:hypothetical protein